MIIQRISEQVWLVADVILLASLCRLHAYARFCGNIVCSVENMLSLQIMQLNTTTLGDVAEIICHLCNIGYLLGRLFFI